MRVAVTFIVAAVVCIAAVPLTAEPIVVNPSFEDDGVNTTTPTGWTAIRRWAPEAVPPAEEDIGWGGAQVYDGGFWDNGITSDGDYVLILEPGAWGPDYIRNPIWIEQEIAGFAIGETYTVGFSYNARTGLENSPTLTVYMDGVQQFQDVGFNNVDPKGVQLTDFYTGSFDYTATAASHTLRFEALADGPSPPDNMDEGVFFDDVTIVPEPGTFVLLAALGLCALAWWKRRR